MHNSRFESLEELRVTVTRVDQNNIYLGKQIDFLIHMQEKNDQKLDNFIFQREVFVSKNVQENKDCVNPMINKKLEKIYQNLDPNLNTTFPVFSTSKTNYDFKLDKSASCDRKYDFSNVVYTGPYNCPNMKKATSNDSDSKTAFDKTQGTDNNMFVNVNTPPNGVKNTKFASNDNTNVKTQFQTPGQNDGFDSNKFC